MIPLSQPMLGRAEFTAVENVLKNGCLVQGEQVANFEGEFAAFIGTSYAIAVNSGTSALQLALMSASLGLGDEVIVPAFTFAATANAVVLAGATPVFADIRSDDYCLDPIATEAAITSRTAAILPVHLYGAVAKMDNFNLLCRKYGLLLLEDAAQAHGAALKGVQAGRWGDAGCFSFYATKNMTTGEGGMIVTDDEVLARKARLLRNQGMEIPYGNEVRGYNMRLTEMQAALGRIQLTRLGSFNEARRTHAEVFDAGVGHANRPSVAVDVHHVYHQYTIRTQKRDTVIADLAARNVEARIYYPTPVHRLPAFEGSPRLVDLPETDCAARQVLSVPVGPHLTVDQVELVRDALIAAL